MSGSVLSLLQSVSMIFVGKENQIVKRKGLIQTPFTVFFNGTNDRKDFSKN